MVELPEVADGGGIAQVKLLPELIGVVQGVAPGELVFARVVVQGDLVVMRQQYLGRR